MRCHDFFIGLFLGERRPKTRMRQKQRLSPSITTCSEIPRFSERVAACILDFTGSLQTDDGEAVCIGNDKEHLQTCQAGNPTLTSAKRCSYGWHDDQLTSAEYNAVVSREISATWITWRRRAEDLVQECFTLRRTMRRRTLAWRENLLMPQTWTMFTTQTLTRQRNRRPFARNCNISPFCI